MKSITVFEHELQNLPLSFGVITFQSSSHGFGIEKFNDDGELIGETVADLARWQPETKSWRMENVRIRHFDGLNETFERHQRLDTMINLHPKDLVRRDNYKTTMTTPDLIHFINKFKKETDIPLDPVYTGKLLFGIVDLIKNGYFDAGTNILAIHTGGLQGIEGMNVYLKNKNLVEII